MTTTTTPRQRLWRSYELHYHGRAITSFGSTLRFRTLDEAKQTALDWDTAHASIQGWVPCEIFNAQTMTYVER